MIPLIQGESSPQDRPDPPQPHAKDGLCVGQEKKRGSAFGLRSRPQAVLVLFTLFLSLLFPSILAAREEQGYFVPMENLRFSLSGAPIYYFPSKVDGGGNLSVFTLILNTEVSKQLNDKLGAGISFTYKYDNYRFSGMDGFSVPFPWSSVHTFTVAVPLFYSLNDKWRLMLIPIGQFSGEDGASFGDALSYGGAVGASYVFGPKLELGLGLAGFYDLAEVRFFPYPILRIKLSDRIRVTNPFRTSPAGPAGVEISYVLNDRWGVGFGWAYRSPRFRLEKNGPIPNGIGEYRNFPIFLRLSYKLSPALRIDGYSGVSLFNKIYINDNKGNELFRTKQNVAPLIGMAISGDF